jgi:MFS family permease
VIPRQNKIFYGWFVVAGTILVWFVTIGVFFYSYGVFLPVMSDTFGWSRTATGAGLTVALLAFGLASPLVGISITKFGPRKNVVLGNLAAALGMFGMSQCKELWQLYVFFGVMVGFGAGFGLYVACTTLVNNWFDAKKPMVMGIVLTAGSLAGFAFPPLTSWLIEAVGWQVTWIIYGGLVLVFSVVIGGLLLIRNTPAEKGLLPLGQTGQGKSTGAGSLVREHGPQYAIGGLESTGGKAMRIIRKPTFWYLVLIGGTSYYALATISAHQVAYLGEIGFTVILAALSYSMVSGMGIIGKLGLGVVAQRITLKKLLIPCFIMQVGAFIILLTAKSPGLVYLYAVLFGIGSGATMAAFPTLVGEYSGRTHYARIMGHIFMLAVIIEACGPIVAGGLYDINSNYTIAFVLVAVFLSLGLISTLLLRPPKAAVNSRARRNSSPDAGHQVPR